MMPQRAIESSTNYKSSETLAGSPSAGQQNVLYIMRGPSGCGKSYFAAAHFVSASIVSPDEIRFAMSDTPYRHASDKECRAFERKVWDKVLGRVRELMAQGAPSICLDATNCRTGHFPRYQTMAAEYGYKICVIDMTNVPFEECLRRNAQREGQRRVPYKAIERQCYDAFVYDVPAGIEVLTPAQAAACLS